MSLTYILLMLLTREVRVGLHAKHDGVVASVVNKDLSFKFKAKAKAKDLTFKAKDLTSEHVQGPF